MRAKPKNNLNIAVPEEELGAASPGFADGNGELLPRGEPFLVCWAGGPAGGARKGRGRTAGATHAVDGDTVAGKNTM